MVCQDVCPANKNHKDWIVDGEEFSEKETEMILNGVSEKELPCQTTGKLRKLYMDGAEKILQRNLGVLIHKRRNGS
jgi:epoxyqueuosine reductase